MGHISFRPLWSTQLVSSLIHLSLWYCKSRQRFLCVFWHFVLADHGKLLCVLLHRCSYCVVVLRRASKLWTVTTLGHGWSRFSGVSYNSLQSLCREIGDTSRSWNKWTCFMQLANPCDCEKIIIILRYVDNYYDRRTLCDTGHRSPRGQASAAQGCRHKSIGYFPPQT